MNKKTTDIVAYLTWIGLLVALLFGKKRSARFHINQALVLTLTGVLWTVVYQVLYRVLGVLSFGLLTGLLGAVNALVDLALLALTVLGIVHAVREEEIPLPVIGGIELYRPE